MAIDAKWRLCVLTLGGLRGPEHDQRGPWPFSERQVSSELQGRAGRRTPSACCYRTSYFTSLKMYYEIGHVIIYSLKTDNKMNVHSTQFKKFRIPCVPLSVTSASLGPGGSHRSGFRVYPLLPFPSSPLYPYPNNTLSCFAYF